MEAGEYGLTRGACFVARRLEVVAVAGRELYEADFHKPGIYVSRRVWANAFFERTRPAESVRPPCLIYLST